MKVLQRHGNVKVFPHRDQWSQLVGEMYTMENTAHQLILYAEQFDERWMIDVNEQQQNTGLD